MKGNKGQAARRKLLKKLGVVLFVFACFIGALAVTEMSLTDHKQITTGGGRADRQSLFNKIRRRSSRRVKIDPALVNDKDYKRILAGDLNLISIEPPERSAMRRADADSYDGVHGTFCKLNWKAHKDDPSSVPMFRDVQAASPKCDKTSVRVPLKEVAELARQMDEKNERLPTDTAVPKTLNFTGIVFHESRCGSTLVANTLIAADPARHRVYSESPPPVTAMKICGDDYDKCTIDQAAAILKDVIYMMARTNDPTEERVFFKIQSIGSRHIEVFRKAFPTTPWIFVYREPVQVMMSHLALGTRKANCLRSLNRPPLITQQLIKQHGFAGGTSQLAPEEFCAAHLATITETALENLQASKYGMAVNYESLPGKMYEQVLPKLMGVPTGQQEIDRILAVSEQYSKGRGEKKKEWKEDSAKKEERASEEIRKAANHFMSESYDALQLLAAK